MKPTIVYLHGLNCSSTIFNHLHSSLPEHNAVFIDYDSQKPLQQSYSVILGRLPKRKPFTIIGHSLGGVLGYLAASRTHYPIAKLITISSPFGGSRAAGILRWFYPSFEIFKDLSPKSDVVKEMQHEGPLCPFLSLVSVEGHLPFLADPNDGIVTIESQTCVTATKRVEIPSNHFEAVQHDKTIQEVTSFTF